MKQLLLTAIFVGVIALSGCCRYSGAAIIWGERPNAPKEVEKKDEWYKNSSAK